MRGAGAQQTAARHASLTRGQVRRAMAILIALVFSKFFYLASITSYYIFYLMQRFHLGARRRRSTSSSSSPPPPPAPSSAARSATGSAARRSSGARSSACCPSPWLCPTPACRKRSCSACSSGSSSPRPSRRSWFSRRSSCRGRSAWSRACSSALAFGMGGIGAAALGVLADWTSITTVYRVCAFLPLIGLLTAFLPNLRPARAKA